MKTQLSIKVTMRMAYKPDFVVSDHSSAHYVTIML